ncbi:Tn3 family transposase [Rhodococcus opacus]|uniref:Tn3 family transposase n=1 Tax=Rhodococcus opacus TaxID=37919 RepID=UPI0006BB4546|nr:Tn3 family transposase [Rhodococcus opacus]
MASIDRTAYPRFKRVVSAQELAEAFTPTPGERGWAREKTQSDPHLLALAVRLKAYQRLGYFPKLDDIPAVVVDTVRGVLDLPGGVSPETDADRTAKRHRKFVREYLGVRYEAAKVRAVAEQAIRAAAATKDNPADLINVALEELVRARCELPGYTTLDAMAATIRAEVNGEFFALVSGRPVWAERARLDRLLVVDPATRRSEFDRIKTPAQAATVGKFKARLAHLQALDAIGPTEAWLDGVPPGKVAHFAGEARVAGVDDMRKTGEAKRVTLLVALVHQQRVEARDEVVTMFCKRMGALHKKGRERLEELREAHEAVSAYHGNNYLPLLERFYRSHRPALFTLADALDMVPTTADRSVLDAVEFIRANRHRRGDWIEETTTHSRDGQQHTVTVDVDTFASVMWRKVLRDGKNRPGMLSRRHLEVCVFSHLAAELRSGNVAVVGSDSYADLGAQLMSWDECAPLAAQFCEQAGIPAEAPALVDFYRRQLTGTAAAVDAGYPANTDLVLEDGKPTLKRRKGADRRPSALALEQAVHQRLPERSLLDILTRAAYLTGWPRHLGPASGSDPKIRGDVLGRYVLTAYAYGANLGATEVARHMRGQISAHELYTAGNKHSTADKVHRCSADVISAFTTLDVAGMWGDGQIVAVDGSQIDTWENNLLAESHIRYGGYGGLAMRFVSDSYIALFSHFMPCGAWEAVYIVDGLLRNESDVQPDTIHADTQGQSLPVFGLAALLGFELLPRIRNWHDLNFYRPTAATRYGHIDSLFGDNAIDWGLIEKHWTDLLRTSISIREGRVSSVTLLRRLGNHSHKNRLYRALRELGRVIRTVTLLRYLSEPGLREQITAVTNKAEAFHGYSEWLMIGGKLIGHNDPDHQERVVKFNELLANCAIYSTALDITDVANGLAAEGYPVDTDDLATITPYIQHTIRRMGDLIWNQFCQGGREKRRP